MNRLASGVLAIALVVFAAPLPGQTREATEQRAMQPSSAASPLSGDSEKKRRRCAEAPDRALFADEFDGPDLDPVWQASLPNAPYRFGSVDAVYLGESGFSFQTLDDSSVIRLQNVLENTQRRGWSSERTFTPEEPVIYEARFNTLVQSPTTGIDELLELWLLDADDPQRYDIVALSTPGFGSGRIFTAGSSVTGTGLDTEFSFDENTWYRMVITGSATQEVRASIYDDARTTELIGVGFGHTLEAYPAGFRIGISQSMGFPDAPFPTDVAVDWVRLTMAPPPRVIIGDCDTQVPNPVFPSGCALSDLVDECSERERKPRHFVDCVVRLAGELKQAGVIDRTQSRDLQACAVRSKMP